MSYQERLQHLASTSGYSPSPSGRLALVRPERKGNWMLTGLVGGPRVLPRTSRHQTASDCLEAVIARRSHEPRAWWDV